MISIVCPFYNERENLEELYSRLAKVTAGFREPWEVIFVDDGSKDSGGSYLKSLLPPGDSFRLVELERRYGLTTALYAGLEASRGEILATLDADLQNPPEEIPRLIDCLKDGDVVAGVRKNRRDGWLKRMSSRIANTIRRAVTGDHIEDIGCSLRVFRRQTLLAFYPYRGMHRFFLTFAELEGFKIKQIPVEHETRRHGRSKYGLMNRLTGPLLDLFAVRWMLSQKIRYRRKGGDHA